MAKTNMLLKKRKREDANLLIASLDRRAKNSTLNRHRENAILTTKCCSDVENLLGEQHPSS